MGDWQVTGAGVVTFGVGLAIQKETFGRSSVTYKPR